jgi:TonB-dependent SusC/RagA subfamily outer membrane receptor
MQVLKDASAASIYGSRAANGVIIITTKKGGKTLSVDYNVQYGSGKLVDQVNAYIDQANTPETIAIATNLRNNAIKLINNSISKLTNLEKTIAQIGSE